MTFKQLRQHADQHGLAVTLTPLPGGDAVHLTVRNTSQDLAVTATDTTPDKAADAVQPLLESIG